MRNTDALVAIIGGLSGPWTNADELAELLASRGVRVVPADAVVVTEEALVYALDRFDIRDFDVDRHSLGLTSEQAAAAILAALREGER